MEEKIRINCIAVVGKQNNPLYLKSFDPQQPDLKYHYIAHTSCDVIEERAASASKTNDLYLGLLYTIDDLAVYGYMTNTRIKFILVLTLRESIIRDAEVRNIFNRIHAAYISLICNPFYEMDNNKFIKSPRFASLIEMIGDSRDN
ncbi:Sedlin, partial [Basidiobolus meristosporus CBS 931.73]